MPADRQNDTDPDDTGDESTDDETDDESTERGAGGAPATVESPGLTDRPSPEVNPQRQPDADPADRAQGGSNKTAPGTDRTDI